jgi:uncharacterized membrane protein YecN with MAPEG domain
MNRKLVWLIWSVAALLMVDHIIHAVAVELGKADD